MIKEIVLKDFPNWDSEKQLKEYQGYKTMGDYSPFSEADYQLMEMVMQNPNAEVSVDCDDGVCEIINEMPNKGDGEDWNFNEFTTEPQEIPFKALSGEYFTKPYKGNYYNILWDGFSKWYLILDDDEKYYVVGYLKLIKYNKLPNTMQVDGIEIHKNFRNKGLSTFLYRSVKSKKGYSIVSDYIQYENSRKIWTSLAKKDGVKIYDEETGKKSDFVSISDYNDSAIWGAKHKNKLLIFESYTLKNKINGEKTLKEQILESFSNWDSEKQISEYQGYKEMGDYSPFDEADYQLMEMVIQNPNAEVSVECYDGVCEIVSALVKENEEIEEYELLMEFIQNSDDNKSLITIFSDLLSNQTVRKNINDDKHKNTIIRVYRAILPLLNDNKKKEKIEDSFKTILSKIPNFTRFKNWESVISINLKPFLKILRANDLLIGDDDTVVFNFDKITPSLAARHDKLTALLLLGLTNYLPDSKKKDFYEDFIEILSIPNGEGDEIEDKNFNQQIKLDDIESNDDELDSINNDLEQMMQNLEIDTIAVDDLNITSHNENKVKTNKKRIKKSFEEYYNAHVKKRGTDDLVFEPTRLEKNMRESYVSNLTETSKNDQIQLEKFLAKIEKNNEFPEKVTKNEALAIFQHIDTKNEVIFSKDESAALLTEKYKSFIEDKGIQAIKTKIKKAKKKFKNNEEKAYSFLDKDPDSFIAAKLSTILNEVGIKVDEADVLEFYKGFKSKNSEINNINPGPGEIKTVLNITLEYMNELGTPWSKYAKTLLTHKSSAEGKGEKFVEFALPYSVSGGQNSYDLKIGPMAYEIKTYTIENNKITPIRLGQEGNVFKVEKFARLFIFLSDLSKIFNNDTKNYKLLTTLFSNSMTKKNFTMLSNMLNNKSTARSNYSLIEQLRKGEFSNNHMILFQKVIKLLEKSLLGVKQNNFYFMKIFLKDKNLDLAIAPLDTTNKKLSSDISSGEKITFETKEVFSKTDQEDMVSTILRILANKEIFEDGYLNKIVEEAMIGINKEFKVHPMIILNDFTKGNPASACGGIHTEFYFYKITQNKFKIVPVGLNVKSSS